MIRSISRTLGLIHSCEVSCPNFTIAVLVISVPRGKAVVARMLRWRIIGACTRLSPNSMMTRAPRLFSFILRRDVYFGNRLPVKWRPSPRHWRMPCERTRQSCGAHRRVRSELSFSSRWRRARTLIGLSNDFFIVRFGDVAHHSRSAF